MEGEEEEIFKEVLPVYLSSKRRRTNKFQVWEEEHLRELFKGLRSYRGQYFVSWEELRQKCPKIVASGFTTMQIHEKVKSLDNKVREAFRASKSEDEILEFLLSPPRKIMREVMRTANEAKIEQANLQDMQNNALQAIFGLNLQSKQVDYYFS
jgi:hypothetical protein